MNLTGLLTEKGVDPRDVLVLRHRPPEPRLYDVLPWLAAEKPDVFNAYQQTHGEQLERAMSGAKYVASFLGREPGRALFVGLYRIGKSHPLSLEEYWEVPAYAEMREFGMRGFPDSGRQAVLRFELDLVDFYEHWKGKLIIGWPPGKAWWRRAHRNDFPLLAVLEESALVPPMPDWQTIDLTWEQLGVLPTRWREALCQWRGIYFIFDTKAGKGYVGAAYGDANILGRWREYAQTGHGGNRLLKDRDPKGFRFSILQRVSPDMAFDDVVRLEASWKGRLHTRKPFGLNDN